MMASISKREVGGKPRYDLNYREPDGRRRRKTFLKKSDAERFTATVEADKAGGSYLDPDAGKVTLKRYADQWLAAQTFDVTSRESVEMHLAARVPGARLQAATGHQAEHDPGLASGASPCRAPISG